MDVVEYSVPTKKKRSTGVVLDEETYTKNLEKIIVRDYFPDHEKLKDEKEYLIAEENKDFEKMRILALKNSRNFEAAKQQNEDSESNTAPTKPTLPTPATFETPTTDRKENLGDENSKKKRKSAHGEGNKKKKIEIDNYSLNKFLANHTSEDNDSFENIMNISEERHKEANEWLYKAESENNETLAITASDEGRMLAIENKVLESKTGEELETFDSRLARPADMWHYKAKNHLMYYPEGEKADDSEFKKPLEVVSKNTRFKDDPFKDTLDRQKIAEVATQNAKFSVGEKVGHDGNIIMPQESPSMRGYKFVGTPSPMPSDDASPLMTWGMIENTPARLKNATPTPGPSFHFPEESKREKLAQKMIGDNTKKNRDKKAAALAAVQRRVSNTPNSRISSMERMSMLSPAARRLVSSKIKLGSSDRSLKASYTPKLSSRRSTNGGLTPLAKTPKIAGLTPKQSPAIASESITDNLLKISATKKLSTPHAKKASDFF